MIRIECLWHVLHFVILFFQIDAVNKTNRMGWYCNTDWWRWYVSVNGQPSISNILQSKANRWLQFWSRSIWRSFNAFETIFTRTERSCTKTNSGMLNCISYHSEWPKINWLSSWYFFLNANWILEWFEIKKSFTRNYFCFSKGWFWMVASDTNPNDDSWPERQFTRIIWPPRNGTHANGTQWISNWDAESRRPEEISGQSKTNSTVFGIEWGVHWRNAISSSFAFASTNR